MILESVILTTIVVVSLTLYTFRAARRGQDFSFLGPFLFAGMMIIMVFALIQVLNPVSLFILFSASVSLSLQTHLTCVHVTFCIVFQLFFPMGRISYMIYGAVAALIFCGYVIYDTDNLIKRYSYDEYVWASVALYLDIVNLFLSLLTCFRAVED